MKVINFIKNNIIGILIGMALTYTTTALAATIISASEVSYDNSSSSLTSSTIQGALNELYILSKKVGSCPDGYICTLKANYAYYAFGTSISESDTPYYTRVVSAGHNVFLKLDGEGNKYVCILRSGASEPFCIIGGSGRNTENYYTSIKENFGNSVSCDEDWSYTSFVSCNDGDFYCTADSDGNVLCTDFGADECCRVYSDESVYCG